MTPKTSDVPNRGKVSLMINHKTIEPWAFTSYTHVKAMMLDNIEIGDLDSKIDFQNSDVRQSGVMVTMTIFFVAFFFFS